MKRLVVAILVALAVPLQVHGTLPAVAASEAITLTPSSVGPGQTFTVSGTGFTPSSTVNITTSPSLVSQSNVTVNSSGDFTTTAITVPSTATPGTYTVNAAYSTAPSPSVANAPLIVPSPSITLNPTTGHAGSTITVSGTNFTPGITVAVQVTVNVSGGTSNADATATVQSNGTFSTPLTVPTGALAGTYTVRAYNGSVSGQQLATTSLTVTNAAAISVSPTTVQPGTATSLTVTGSGFSPGETVTISYQAKLSDGSTPTESIVVSAGTDGSFLASPSNGNALPVPSNIVPGTYTITAAGAVSHSSPTTTFTVTTSPAITLTPSTVAPGQSVAVAGSLFLPNLAVVITTVFHTTGGVAVTQTNSATALSNGTFSTSIPVPGDAQAGSATVTATQTPSSGSSVSASGTFSVLAYHGVISITPGSVAPGGEITVTGSGFAPNSVVTVSFSVQVSSIGTPTPEAGNFNTDSNGDFTGQFLISGTAVTSAVNVTATQSLFGVTATGAFVITAPNSTATPTSTPTSTPTVTPTPSPTPTISPTPTSTPIVTPTPTPSPSRGGLHFRRLSLWYHVVRLGTFDHVDLQSNMKTRLGIWAHVIFPSGVQFNYYENTDSRGHWIKTFDVPLNSISRYSNRAFILFQLWHGRTSVKDYLPFTVIR